MTRSSRGNGHCRLRRTKDGVDARQRARAGRRIRPGLSGRGHRPGRCFCCRIYAHNDAAIFRGSAPMLFCFYGVGFLHERELTMRAKHSRVAKASVKFGWCSSSVAGFVTETGSSDGNGQVTMSHGGFRIAAVAFRPSSFSTRSGYISASPSPVPSRPVNRQNDTLCRFNDLAGKGRAGPKVCRLPAGGGRIRTSRSRSAR